MGIVTFAVTAAMVGYILRRRRKKNKEEKKNEKSDTG